MSTSGSGVWNFFKKLDIKTVSCNLCGKTYKSSGNTTNLATHLKNKHHFAYIKSVKSKSAAKVSRSQTATSATAVSNRPSSPQPSTSAVLEIENDVSIP